MATDKPAAAPNDRNLVDGEHLESAALAMLRNQLAVAQRDVEDGESRLETVKVEQEAAALNVEFWKGDLAKVVARRDDFADAIRRLTDG